MNRNKTRRQFIRQLGGASLLLSAGNIPTTAAEKHRHEEYILDITRPTGPADTVRIAGIGMGTQSYPPVRSLIHWDPSAMKIVS